MVKEKEKKREFQHESLQDRGSITGYLAAVTEGFEKGEICFSDKQGDLALEPRGLIGFEVKATMKNGRSRLNISFEWKDKQDKREEDNGLLEIKTTRS